MLMRAKNWPFSERRIQVVVLLPIERKESALGGCPWLRVSTMKFFFEKRKKASGSR